MATPEELENRTRTDEHTHPLGESGKLSILRNWLNLAAIMLMVVTAGLGAWSGIYAASNVDGPGGPIPTPDPARVRPATIETSLSTATSRATAWASDARLFSVTAQFDYATNPNDAFGTPVGGWLVFVFVRGKGEDTEALTLLIERNRAEIVRETTRSLNVHAPGLDPVELSGAAVDSAQALTIAEARSGQMFRAGCLRSRHVARLTFRPADETENSAWVISYNDARVANGPVVRVFVDAKTGMATVSQLDATLPASVDLNTCPT